MKKLFLLLMCYTTHLFCMDRITKNFIRQIELSICCVEPDDQDDIQKLTNISIGSMLAGCNYCCCSQLPCCSTSSCATIIGPNVFCCAGTTLCVLGCFWAYKADQAKIALRQAKPRVIFMKTD